MGKGSQQISFIRFLLFTGLIGTALLLAQSTLLAQSSYKECALRADVPEDDKAAYRQRGDRCDGIYIQPISASTKLILRGFHLGPPQYDLLKDKKLSVKVIGFSAEAQGGRLVATSMRPRHFYQMDTDAISSKGQYIWDMEILKNRAVSLESKDLAVQFSKNGDGLKVWPVQITSADKDANISEPVPYLVLESEVELARIKVTTKQAKTDEIVDNRFYSRRFHADDLIRVPLRINDPGAYEVSLTSFGSSGSTATLRLVAMLSEQAFEYASN